MKDLCDAQRYEITQQADEQIFTNARQGNEFKLATVAFVIALADHDTGFNHFQSPTIGLKRPGFSGGSHL